jgi:hypothetical protein
VNTWSKVRAEASRWVNGAPRSQALRTTLCDQRQAENAQALYV